MVHNIPPVNHQTFNLINMHLVRGDAIWLQLICDGNPFNIHLSLIRNGNIFEDLLTRMLHGNIPMELDLGEACMMYVSNDFGEEYSIKLDSDTDINKTVRNICFAVAKNYTQVDVNGAMTE